MPQEPYCTVQALTLFLKGEGGAGFHDASLCSSGEASISPRMPEVLLVKTLPEDNEFKILKNRVCLKNRRLRGDLINILRMIVRRMGPDSLQ